MNILELIEYMEELPINTILFPLCMSIVIASMIASILSLIFRVLLVKLDSQVFDRNSLWVFTFILTIFIYNTIKNIFH